MQKQLALSPRQKFIEELLNGATLLQLQEFLAREEAFLTLRYKKNIWHAQVVHQSGFYGSGRDRNMLVAMKAAIIMYEEHSS